eukprot:scaffold29678_cov21-Tisochrysis_lutea.AAC.2
MHPACNDRTTFIKDAVSRVLCFHQDHKAPASCFCLSTLRHVKPCSVQPESCWAPNALCAWASMLEASLAPDPCCMSVRIPEGGGAAAL